MLCCALTASTLLRCCRKLLVYVHDGQRIFCQSILRIFEYFASVLGSTSNIKKEMFHRHRCHVERDNNERSCF